MEQRNIEIKGEDYSIIESVIKKIAEENKISNVTGISITINKEGGVLQFKKSWEEGDTDPSALPRKVHKQPFTVQKSPRTEVPEEAAVEIEDKAREMFGPEITLAELTEIQIKELRRTLPPNLKRVLHSITGY